MKETNLHPSFKGPKHFNPFLPSRLSPVTWRNIYPCLEPEVQGQSHVLRAVLGGDPVVARRQLDVPPRRRRGREGHVHRREGLGVHVTDAQQSGHVVLD